MNELPNALAGRQVYPGYSPRGPASAGETALRARLGILPDGDPWHLLLLCSLVHGLPGGSALAGESLRTWTSDLTRRPLFSVPEGLELSAGEDLPGIRRRATEWPVSGSLSWEKLSPESARVSVGTRADTVAGETDTDGFFHAAYPSWTGFSGSVSGDGPAVFLHRPVSVDWTIARRGLAESISSIAPTLEYAGVLAAFFDAALDADAVAIACAGLARSVMSEGGSRP